MLGSVQDGGLGQGADTPPRLGSVQAPGMGTSMDTLEGALLTYLNQAAVGLIVAEGAAWTFPDLANLGSTYSAAGLKAPYMSQPRPPAALIRKGTGMDTPEGAAWNFL
ncbi:hypothetical protein V6N12_022689 [Hibiscus sabdariffa]|uniref:Uncharacterized protein n=1 Tax=Hibiscus sabdariffa TaxID=183260 RepID=A0ABR2FVF3_9ROSI